MQLLLLLFSFVVFFSLLSVAELFILKKLGFDVMAKRYRFFSRLSEQSHLFLYNPSYLLVSWFGPMEL